MIPLASAATVLVFIVTLVGAVWAQAAVYIGYVAAIVIKGMLWVIQSCSAVPFVALDVASMPWYALLACFAVLLACSRYVLADIKTKAVFSGALAAFTLLVMLISAPSGMYMVFLDVGQGDAAYIRTAQGGQYFIDGGRELSAEEFVSFTVRQGITPDAAFVTHTDDDHFSGLKALYEAGLLHKAYCSYQEEEAVREAMPGAEVVPLCAGDTVQLDDTARAVVLYPYRDTVSEDKNEQSLVLLVEYNGHTALFAGDTPGAVETEIFASVGGVDIYKAAHHGSNGSSYRLPLSALEPEYSVVSVGSNRFGHPGELAVDNLQYYSGEVFYTIDDYAVEFFIGGGIRVHTYGGRD